MSEAEAAPVRVLVAEDEPTSRILTRQALEKAGFAVDEADNGDAALQAFDRERPDLVLLDVEMPGLDGFAVCRALRQRPGGANLPIIMMTGRDDVDSIDAAYACGATDFIAKPINWALLGHRARYVLRSSSAATRIERLSRISAVLSGINSAIVRIRQAPELLEEACRIAVQQGHFALAWVGLLEPGSDEIRPQIWAGDEQGFLEGVVFSTRADRPEGNTLIGRAFRERVPLVSNDIAKDRLRRSALAVELGFHGFVVLPLVVENQCAGVLALYSRSPGFFDAEEMRLLGELAGDVSFGLDHIGKEQRLQHLAYYDALTGLPNRSLFQERLVALTEATRPGPRKVVTVILDVRGFHAVNDHHGRNGGDALLRQIAQRLRETVRTSDTLGRIGGDQFGLILTDIAAQALIAPLLDKVFVALAAPFDLGGKPVRVLVKAGVTVFPGEGDGATAEALILNAEAALKQAKASPGQCQFFAPHINAAISHRASMEGKLLRAIEEERFELHYQPKVDLRSGAIVGLEALLRMRDEGELLSPMRFVPFLEETGLIIEVGRWLLQRAARDQARLRDSGWPALRVSVNVSPVQLRQPAFAADVQAALREADPKNGGIDLEITESVLIGDPERHLGVLHELRQMGIGVALDDFGTGYSSLSYLSRLPVNSLKVDKSFLDDVAASREKLAILSAVISLAHALDMRTVAEGVESHDQARLLRLLNCDEVQGFLVARPMPIDAVETLLLQRGTAPWLVIPRAGEQGTWPPVKALQ